MSNRPGRYNANLPGNLTYRKGRQSYYWRNPVTGQTRAAFAGAVYCNTLGGFGNGRMAGERDEYRIANGATARRHHVNEVQRYS